MFELRQLRYFVAVAEEEHVGRAAKRLHITQSPLSRQIIDLEDKLGFSLFHRSKKRIKLTAMGRDFLNEARALLSHSERIEKRAKSIAMGASGTLAIGYVDGALHCKVLSEPLKALHHSHAGIEIELTPLRSSQQFRKLQSGDIDIALTYCEAIGMEGVTSKHVYSDSLMLAAPKDRGWSGQVNPEGLANEKFIWLPLAEYPDSHQSLIQMCARIGFCPDIQYEASSPLAALEMVNMGLGLALVQSSFKQLLPHNVQLLNMPKAFGETIDIYLVHRSEPTSLEARFIQELDNIKIPERIRVTSE